MDFKLNDEQRLIRKAARDFATKELAPNAREWEESHTFSREVFDKMGRLDFTGLYIPEEHGGTEVGRLTAALIFETSQRMFCNRCLHERPQHGGEPDIPIRE